MPRAFLTIVSLLAALISIATNTTANAQIVRGDRWVRLKTETIDITKGVADIGLEKTKGSYKALRLRAANRGVVLSEVQVNYIKSETHFEKRSINLRRRERTRPINLSRTEKFLEAVTLEFKPQRKGRKAAQIEVWGLQSRKGRRAKRPATTAVAATDENTTTQTAGVNSGSETPSTPVVEKLIPNAAASLTSTASESGDVLFAAEHVGFTNDTKVVRVGAKVGKFRRIRLRVADNDIVLKKLEIHYGDGQSETRDIDSKIKRNSTTEWFDLAGDRFVDEIRLQYESRPNFQGQARIEAFGEYADGWLGPSGEARKFNSGWVMLGAQAAGFIGFDKDAIQVSTNEGNFDMLEVRVRDRAITLNELRLIYGDGKIDVIPVKTRVKAGKSFGPIRIVRNNRQVTEIQARYRSRFLDREARNKGSAIVEFWTKN